MPFFRPEPRLLEFSSNDGAASEVESRHAQSSRRGFTISLDGYGAGPQQDLQNPLGIGGTELHQWLFPTRTLQQTLFGKDGGATGVDDDFAARGSQNVGAWILGRNMFSPERRPWLDMNWKGWWGDSPPYHVQTFILTHHPRPSIEMEGGTTFHFVTGGIHEALDRARAAAGAKDVRIGGGASTIQQFLRERLIDEMHFAIAPVLLGSGERPFDGLDRAPSATNASSSSLRRRPRTWCCGAKNANDGTPPEARTSTSFTRSERERRIQKRVTIGGIVAAAVYGLLVRLFLSPAGQALDLERAFVVMSFGFICGVPFSLGFIAVFVGRVRSLWRALVFPQLPALAALGVSLLLAWEGVICVWLWLPLVIVLAALGGLAGAAALRLPSPIGRGSSLAAALVLPYGGMFLEHDLPTPAELRVVDTFIDIAAPPKWCGERSSKSRTFKRASILSRSLISLDSRGRSPPSPLVVASVPCVEASFEGGVVFIETVTHFDENKAPSFSIHADPNGIPARSLDEHVTVGGPYFDVLQGTYRIEPTQHGVRLHLASEHRLSTNFNFYSGFWTDFIMRDTQQYILEIVRRRAERATHD